ncbi:hypothetical protein [Streptomyces sp. NRRL B-24484]|uniref:hypothetical protein n=1 Tax=Streptomyces sp. NRRL B-24484 TaxID=1463833 RepID=UPI0004C0078B|nr:hypothetical protein [Streptomyces sp. NRRL B-24484]
MKIKLMASARNVRASVLIVSGNTITILSGTQHPDGRDGEVVAVVTDRAAQRAKELHAEDVLEGLRRELAHQPRLGQLIRTVTEGGQQVELYSTRIEGDVAAGRPAINAVHAYSPAPPWPPTVRIAALVPEDPPRPEL